MKVRIAHSADLARIVDLFDAYRQFYGRASNVDGAASFLAERFRKGDSVLILAETSECCAGFLQLYPSHSSVAMQRVWILNDLFVALEYRRQGIGRELINAAIEFSRRDGAARLDLATATDNVAAKVLYESLGWNQDSDFTHYKYVL